MIKDSRLPTQADRHLAPHREFADPPVIETVLSVQFEPLSSWAVPHFGLFWETVKDRFPEFEDQLPLQPEVEAFGKPNQPLIPRLEFLSRPSARCWFRNTTDGLLLQVQNGRFVQNWRKEKGQAETYPQYDTTRASFEQYWAGFLAFLKKWGLGETIVQQCEMSYVNHLEIGKGWRSLKDIGDIFPALSKLPTEGLLEPDALRLDVRYLLPEGRGRLYATIHPAVRNTDGKEVLVFTLTARGAPSSSASNHILAWFDFGRDWIHRAFDAHTSASIKDAWGERKAI